MPSSLGARLRRWFAGPGWLGVPVAVFGAVWVYGAEGISSTTGFQGIGPAVMVRGVGIALVVLGLLLAIGSFRAAPAPGAGDAEADASAAATAPTSAPRWRTLGLALFALLLAPLALPVLGFPLVAMVVFALIARAFGSRRLGLDLAIGAALGALAWWGFSGLGISLGPALPF